MLVGWLRVGRARDASNKDSMVVSNDVSPHITYLYPTMKGNLLTEIYRNMLYVLGRNDDTDNNDSSNGNLGSSHNDRNASANNYGDENATDANSDEED